MLAHCLVLPGSTNSQKSRKISEKTVTSHQADEITFIFSVLLEGICIIIHKIYFMTVLKLQPCS